MFYERFSLFFILIGILLYNFINIQCTFNLYLFTLLLFYNFGEFRLILLRIMLQATRWRLR